MLNVINENNKATGVAYETNEPKFHAHHEQYGHKCVWLDRKLEAGEELTQQELDEAIAYNVRAERDRRIEEVAWRYQRWEREQRLGVTPTDDIAELDNHIQLLADITEQPGFPHDVNWPEKFLGNP